MSLTEKNKSAALWIAAILLISAISGYTTWRTEHLEKKISAANATIQMMKLEHEAAIIAVNEAYDSRKDVYEMARERLCQAESAMGRESSFCDMALPDDLRLLWEKPGYEHDGLRSASGSPEGH